MSSQKLLQTLRLSSSQRFFNQSSKCLDSKAPESSIKTPPSSSSSNASSSAVNESIIGPRMKIPTEFDKFILVWMKKFPKGQVPSRVSEDFVYQTKNRARVKAANYLMAITAIMFAVTIYYGKQARKRGESIQEMNLEWHRKINEEHQAKLKSSNNQ